MYKKGAIVRLSDEFVENYPEKYNKEMVITHISTKYMPANEFFAKNKPEGYHPGYDECANGKPLYDLKDKETNEDIPFSLYYWEIERV